MRHAPPITLLLILFFLALAGYAQDKLMFIKNRHKIAFYQTGDVISFRLKGQKNKITATITGFDDSLIVFRNYRIHPDEISHLYVDEQTIVWFILKYKYERIFLFGGAGYLALDILNTGEISKETLALSGGLILAGVIAHVAINDTMRVKRRRKLVILHSPSWGR